MFSSQYICDSKKMFSLNMTSKISVQYSYSNTKLNIYIKNEPHCTNQSH